MSDDTSEFRARAQRAADDYHMPLGELAQQLCATVRAELSRLVFATPAQCALPPPHDLDLERSVLGHIMEGRIAPHDVPVDDYYWEPHRDIARVLGLRAERREGVGADGVARVLVAGGWPVEQAAEIITRCTAMPTVLFCALLAEKLRMLARRRRTIAAWQRVDAAWREGRTASPADIETAMLGLAAERGGEQ